MMEVAMSEQERRVRDVQDAIRDAWNEDENERIDELVEKLYALVENDENAFRKSLKFLTKLGLM
jgi:hypothetical protein